MNTIGILGAGKVGIVIAQLLLAAGYKVVIAGSEAPQKIALTVKVLTPGASAMTKEQVANEADIIILALPLGKYQTIPKDELAGKLVIDAMNYWWEVDGERPDLKDLSTSTSETVQKFLSDSRIVKAFSHIGYHDLHGETRATGMPGRKAIAIAGNNEEDLETVAGLVDDIGFDPIVIGPLAFGIRLEPGSNVFGAHIQAAELQSMINHFPETEMGKKVTAACQ
jgi:predicted dinucleotide-binding enzyme